jgi:hypothetical protein
MKILILLALLSLVPVPEPKERIKSFRNSKRFEVKYDKFTDETRISVGPFLVGSFKAYFMRGSQLEMSALFFMTKSPVKEIYLVFESSSRDWRFLRNSELYALADGERLAFGEADDTDSRIRGRGVSEAVSYAIPLDAFFKLAKASHAELKIGNIQLELKDEHLEAFRDLYSLSR